PSDWIIDGVRLLAPNRFTGVQSAIGAAGVPQWKTPFWSWNAGPRGLAGLGGSTAPDWRGVGEGRPEVKDSAPDVVLTVPSNPVPTRTECSSGSTERGQPRRGASSPARWGRRTGCMGWSGRRGWR